MSTLKRLTIFVFLIVLTACSAAPMATPTPLSPLVENRQKWESQNINHYRFTLSIICFCAFSDKMPLTIEVKDGQVVSMVDNQGQPVTDFKDTFDQYSSIEKLFELLDLAMNGGADKVTVTYHATYGYPEAVDIDYVEEAIDDEISFTISNLEVLN
jgi:hypothetical protein